MDYHNPLSRWLAAERSGTTERVESALTQLFAMLTQPAPSAGFADRVVGRLAPMPQVEKVALVWRLTLAACLMLVALSVAWLPVVVMPLIEAANVGRLVGILTAGLVAGSQVLAGWLSFWHSLIEVNRVVVTVVSKPPVAATLIAVAGLTAVSFRAFSVLMAAERSTHHG